MNAIGTRIRKIREERGIKQEYIAGEMGITQSNYGRLEKDDNRLTANKLIRISEILNVSVSVLFGEKATNVIHENKGDNAQAHIGTFVQQDKDHIESLKEEIKFLRKILADKNGLVSV
ncbi:MAG: helix-turn-helix domain-containing protein [Dysgonamonadaceae bacterium]|jgi:transcriptional regulator with XRE-family HTH domain|nr:helix-turn-helix domain-containing protein [Dysgonamonadaceae bacterium]